MSDLVGNLEDRFSIMIFQMSPEEKNSLTEKLAAAGNMNASTVDTKEYFKVSLKLYTLRKHAHAINIQRFFTAVKMTIFS